MKMPKQSSRGSMGIPSEIHPDTLARQRAQSEAMREQAKENVDPAFAAETMQFPAESGEDEQEEEDGDEAAAPAQVEEPSAAAKEAAAAAKDAHPVLIMRRLGVEITDEDFHNYLFKGYIEKTIKIAYDPLTKKPFTATFRTLTTQEYDEVDELLAEEMDSRKMTVAGRDSRRSVWLLAFAMIKVDGRLLAADVLKKGPNGVALVDTKATARRRIEMTRSFSGTILDKSSRLYGAFVAALTMMMEDPESNYLKKP